MLRPRLWMGAVLAALTLGVIIADQYLAPWYPCLLLLLLGLSLGASIELVHMLGPSRRPESWICHVGVGVMVLANWLPHLPALAGLSPWECVAGALALMVLLATIVEMTLFTEAGQSIERIARGLWVICYVGLLPSFFAQIRWLGPTTGAGHEVYGMTAMALAIFVPKCGDIGAYITGRLVGRHEMTPLLSPKKTWEGAAGGLTLAVVTAIGINRAAPERVLPDNWIAEIGFGLTVGIAGMLGDLAESLFKRDCQQKDASQVVPGFGGVLDVVDAVIFAGPVAYLWFRLTG